MRQFLAGVLFSLAFLACACGSGTPSSPSAMSSTPSTQTPSTGGGGSTSTPAAGTWTSEGVRLDGAAAGFSGVFADTSTIQLNDGRWRMYVFANDQYRSAISPDGLSFTMEAGVRLPVGDGHIRVLRLPDGRIRAYNISQDGIVSSVSTDDGTTFTREAGFRVTGSAIGFTPSGCSIVRLSNGMWRMYFSSLPLPGEGPRAHPVRSATSADLLNWTLDEGIRIGPGATLTESAEHPAALANADGSISLFYFRNTSFKMMMATSRDGLLFTTESDTGIAQANDPDVVTLSNGRVRMYYNWSEGSATGSVSSATYSGPAFTAPIGMAVQSWRPGIPAAGGSGWKFGFTPAWGR